MMSDFLSLLEAPQLGEIAWHAFAADETVATVSTEHAERLAAVLKSHASIEIDQARILEVGAYRHFTGYIIERDFPVEVTLTDISSNALLDGLSSARKNGLNSRPRLVASDFHDLPFSDGYFDVVFVASSIHHSLRPEVVLNELFRVLSPGGTLIVENEPCRREFCFYQFRSNREDSFTPFEHYLLEQGLLRTISSPFWGSRPEQLFGMVENDKIPLQLFRSIFSQQAEVKEFVLDYAPQLGPLENWLLTLDPASTDIYDSICSRLRAEFELASKHFGVQDRLLGYSLPTECHLYSVAERAARALKLMQLEDRDRDVEMANLFGAALTTILRKNTNGSHHRGSEPFRRPLIQDNEVWQEISSNAGVGPLLGRNLLPDIYRRENAEQLAAWFPLSDWDIVPEEIGTNSLINKGALSRIKVGELESDAILLIRFYAVVNDSGPYKVVVRNGNQILDEQVIVLPESRLSRSLVRSGPTNILIEIFDLNGNHQPLYGCLHLGVCQLITINANPEAGTS